MGRYIVDERFGTICTKCNQYFSFGENGMGTSGISSIPQQLGAFKYYDVVTYPKGDASIIQATCGGCNTRADYPYEKIFMPPEYAKQDQALSQKDRELKDLRGELEEQQGSNRRLQGELDEAEGVIKQKDADISKFAEGFFQLGKEVAKRNAPEPSDEPQSKKPEKKTTYEGTNI